MANKKTHVIWTPQNVLTCVFFSFSLLYAFKPHFIYVLLKLGLKTFFFKYPHYFTKNECCLSTKAARLHNPLRKGYVRVVLTSMRRILSVSLLRHFSLFGRNHPSRISLSVGERGAFARNFCSKTISDGSTMDLSNMRKKYRGEQEVSGHSKQKHYVLCWANQGRSHSLEVQGHKVTILQRAKSVVRKLVLRTQWP